MKSASFGEKLFNILNIVFMVVYSFLCLAPLINILALSLNNGTDSMKGGIYLFPRIWTLENYKMIFQDNRIVGSALISIYRTTAGTVLAVLLNSCFAFALAKRDLPGRRFINWFIFIPMYFGGGLIPYYLICKNLGLINNFLVFVIPSIYSSFYILMLRVYYRGMSSSLEESAKIDGAGYFTIFFRIYFPLSAPALATVALLAGVGLWNDWYDGLVMVSDSRMWPLQTLLLHIVQGNDTMALFRKRNMAGIGSMAKKIAFTTESLKMAMLIITTLPIVLIYPFLQKYFIKGLMIGSIKE